MHMMFRNMVFVCRGAYAPLRQYIFLNPLYNIPKITGNIMDALHIVYAYFAKVFMQSHLNENKQK